MLCPIRKITIRQDQQDWFDGDLRSAIENNSKLFKKACDSRKDDDWNLYVPLTFFGMKFKIIGKIKTRNTSLSNNLCPK